MYLGCGVGENEEEEEKKKQGSEKTDLGGNGLLLNHGLVIRNSHYCRPIVPQAAVTSSQGVTLPIFR